MRVSNDHLADPAALEAAWRRDGYLFFRSVLDLDEVASVRRLIEAELLRQGILVAAEGGGDGVVLEAVVFGGVAEDGAH